MDRPTATALRLVHITTVPLTLRFFRGQIQYLISQGYEVHIISSPGEFLDEFGREDSVHIYPIPMSRRIDVVGTVISVVRLWRTLRQISPAIVHSHTPKAALLGTVTARLLNVRVVVASVFGLPQMTRSGISRRVLNVSTWLTCRMAHAVWCDSYSIRRILVSEGLCSVDKAVVLGRGSVNGVDAEGRFRPAIDGACERARRMHGIDESAVVMGFVGRVVADKGIRELCAAWRILRSQLPTLHMFVVGPLEDPHGLPEADVALMHQDKRVHLAGFQDDVASCMAAMDILVLPSYREGFGVTAIEAAAMELPVVATSIPGCVDSVVDGVTGTLVELGDVGALAEAIMMYCSDPDLRMAHGRAGRERVQRDFRPDVIWTELDNLYRRLLQDESREGRH